MSCSAREGLKEFNYRGIDKDAQTDFCFSYQIIPVKTVKSGKGHLSISSGSVLSYEFPSSSSISVVFRSIVYNQAIVYIHQNFLKVVVYVFIIYQ